VLELQLIVMGLTFLCGLSLGLVFDIWRACRYLWHSGRLATSVGDLLFWLVAAVTVAVVLLFANYGELRGWYLFSLSLGFVCYQEMLSSYMKRPVQRFLHFFFTGLKRLAIGLGLPVWLPLRFIVRKGAAGGRKGKKIGRALARLIKRKLKYWNRKKGP
jgi:spore cortex biosynthesis protein YabQ